MFSDLDRVTLRSFSHNFVIQLIAHQKLWVIGLECKWVKKRWWRLRVAHKPTGARI